MAARRQLRHQAIGPSGHRARQHHGWSTVSTAGNMLRCIPLLATKASPPQLHRTVPDEVYEDYVLEPVGLRGNNMDQDRELTTYPSTSTSIGDVLRSRQRTPSCFTHPEGECIKEVVIRDHGDLRSSKNCRRRSNHRELLPLAASPTRTSQSSPYQRRDSTSMAGAELEAPPRCAGPPRRSPRIPPQCSAEPWSWSRSVLGSHRTRGWENQHIDDDGHGTGRRNGHG